MAKSKMMKQLSLLMATITTAGFSGLAACGPEKVYERDDITTIYVALYDGGYGTDYLAPTIERFETEYADFVNGDRTGVEVEVIQNRNTNVFQGATFADADVYFVEQGGSYLQGYRQGHMADITDILTEEIEGQGHSIVDVMDPRLNDYFGVDVNGETRYYGLQYATAFYSFVYDADLFYSFGFYWTRDYDEYIVANDSKVNALKDIPDGSFTEPMDKNVTAAELVSEGGASYYKTKNGEYLSHGPDGKYGTSDDGLSATYKDFFLLCDRMLENNVDPFLYCSETYLRQAAANLVADYEGAKGMDILFEFDGIAKNLVSVDNDGNVTKLGDKIINSKNEADTFKTAGKYYACSFLERMYANGAEYFSADCFRGQTDQFEKQETFMLSKKDRKKIGYLVDGCWWEHEAKETYKKLENAFGEEYAKENRNFKVFSYPKIDRDHLGTATFLDSNISVAYVLSNKDKTVETLAKKFLQFCFTDQANKEFTTITGTPRPYDYELSEEEYNSLSTYSKSIWDIFKSSDDAFFYTTKDTEYYRNGSALTPTPRYFFRTVINNTQYDSIQQMFKDEGFTAKQVFDGLYTYVRDL